MVSIKFHNEVHPQMFLLYEWYYTLKMADTDDHTISIWKSQYFTISKPGAVQVTAPLLLLLGIFN